MRIYYRVTSGTIQLNGQRYPQGAEFTASEKTVRGLRAAGVVERITPHIVYRRAALPNTYMPVRSIRPREQLSLLPKGELRLLRKDNRFVRRVAEMFPEMGMMEIRNTPKKKLVEMIIEKRGY